MGVESPQHCPTALSGGNSWTDRHQVQETSTSTRAPLGGPALLGRPSILPACPPPTPGTPGQSSCTHSLSRHLYFLTPPCLGQNTSSLCGILATLVGGRGGERGGGSPRFHLPVNRKQGAGRQAVDKQQSGEFDKDTPCGREMASLRTECEQADTSSPPRPRTRLGTNVPAKGNSCQLPHLEA